MSERGHAKLFRKLMIMLPNMDEAPKQLAIVPQER